VSSCRSSRRGPGSFGGSSSFFFGDESEGFFVAVVSAEESGPFDVAREEEEREEERVESERQREREREKEHPLGIVFVPAGSLSRSSTSNSGKKNVNDGNEKTFSPGLAPASSRLLRLLSLLS